VGLGSVIGSRPASDDSATILRLVTAPIEEAEEAEEAKTAIEQKPEPVEVEAEVLRPEPVQAASEAEKISVVVPTAPIVAAPAPNPVETTLEASDDPEQGMPAQTPLLSVVALAAVKPIEMATPPSGRLKTDAREAEPAAAGAGAMPSYRVGPRPAYPVKARRLHQEGVVMLRVRISPRGQTQEVSVSGTSGHPLLDKTALDAIKKWSFHPAIRGGRAIEAEVTIPIEFKLVD
jgi:protein TonB